MLSSWHSTSFKDWETQLQCFYCMSISDVCSVVTLCKNSRIFPKLHHSNVLFVIKAVYSLNLALHLIRYTVSKETRILDRDRYRHFWFNTMIFCTLLLSYNCTFCNSELEFKSLLCSLIACLFILFYFRYLVQ
jgi:hypothetical protein